MIVIGDLLKKLNITEVDLRQYATELNLNSKSFDSPHLNNLIISRETYNTIIKIHLEKGVQEQKKIVVFQYNETYRFIGTIKWYYNKQTNGEYGFLELNGFPDIHFTGSSYLYNNPRNLKPGDEVVVTLDKKAVDSKKTNICALSVNDITDEKDISFLLFYLLNHFQTLNSKKIETLIEQISKLSDQLKENEIKAIELFIDEKIKIQDLATDQLKHIPSLLKACKINLNYLNNTLSDLSADKILQLLIYNEDLDIPFGQIKEPLKNRIKVSLSNIMNPFKASFVKRKGSTTLINKELDLLSRLSIVEQKEVLDDLLEETCNTFENSKSEYLGDILSIYQHLKITVDFNILTIKLSSEIIFKIWLNKGNLIVDFKIIKPELCKYISSDFRHNLNQLVRLNLLNIDEKKEILDQIFLELCYLNDNNKYDYLVSIIKLYNQFELPVNFEKISAEQHLRLWEDEFIEEFPFNQVYNKLIKFKDEYYDTKPELTGALFDHVEYIQKIKENDLKNILAKTYYDDGEINNDPVFKTILFFIKHIPENYKAEYIDIIFEKASYYYKLHLFILDYTDIVDYNEVVIYTGLLSSSNQKLFFKKTIKLIAENRIHVTLEDLNRIITIDYHTSEYAKEIDGVGLDFTLSVILKVITDLKNKVLTSRTTIFDLIANQIKTPQDFLVIDGFFDKCTGKTIIEENGSITLDSGEHKTIYKTTKKEHFLPRFSTFCDGRKAIKKESTELILCKKSGFEFWWCENSQCYQVCRTTHTPFQWKNYTLEDALKILKIPYNPTQYEILLNLINRVNRFLGHLSCRKCNTILKPKGKTNYSFYGVSMFACQNNDCEEKSKDIYLSHCLNGQCEDIIDSRDSVKCKTHGYKEECGWYICKNCNACCSSEKLRARAGNLEKLGQEYKCHLDGHRDRGIICCSDCGNEMKETLSSSELYQKQLAWFIEFKDKHINITNSGQRKKDNKWWFIWSRGHFSYEEYRKQLQSLFSAGFSIPDFNNKESDHQLVSEPFDEKRLDVNKIFVCPNCDYHFDLNNNEIFDYARKKAVQKFHFNIWTNTNS